MLSDINGGVIYSPYFDLNVWNLKNHSDIYNFNALDQMILNVLFTIPGERLFNLNFGGPLYNMLFKNNTDNVIVDAMTTITNILETKIPDITIDRQNSSFITNGQDNTGTLTIFYYSESLGSYHQLSKLITK